MDKKQNNLIYNFKILIIKKNLRNLVKLKNNLNMTKIATMWGNLKQFFSFEADMLKGTKYMLKTSKLLLRKKTK